MDKNICPYCGSQLEEGYIVPPNGHSSLWWVSFGKHFGILAKTKRKLFQKGVAVFKDDTLSVIEAPTKYCRSVIPLSYMAKISKDSIVKHSMILTSKIQQISKRCSLIISFYLLK